MCKQNEQMHDNIYAFVFVLACFRYLKLDRALSRKKSLQQIPETTIRIIRAQWDKGRKHRTVKTENDMSFKFKFASVITITIQQHNIYIYDTRFKMFIQGYSSVHDTNNNKEIN